MSAAKLLLLPGATPLINSPATKEANNNIETNDLTLISMEKN